MYKYHPFPVVNPALETVRSDVEAGQINLVSIARTWVIALPNLRVILVAGRRPRQKPYKASDNGSIARVSTAAVQSVLPRTMPCLGCPMADVGPFIPIKRFANE